jgi:hypothetical protein
VANNRLTLQNNANLVQIENTLNSGNATVYRETNSLKKKIDLCIVVKFHKFSNFKKKLLSLENISQILLL